MAAHDHPRDVTSQHPSTCTCRAHPLPAEMRVRDALAAYLAENGFTTESYEHPTTQGSLFGVKFRVPNPPPHRRAIRLHDLHHVATGFGTDHAGEGELSAWQLRRGLRGTGMYVVAIVVVNTVLGALVAPRRTFHALRAAGAGGSLFGAPVEHADLLGRTVGELRELLAIPRQGLATLPRGLHPHAPV